ncbi:hypothetical protein BS17DRAFT_683706, partial [Gyrodon lividus]
VINLLFGREVAQISWDFDVCTQHSTEYEIALDERTYCIWDRVGLLQPEIRFYTFVDAVQDAHKLIQRLSRQVGLHLLSMCMKAGPITAFDHRNYRLF